MNISKTLFLSLFLVLGGVAPAAAGPMKVFVTIPPQKYFVEKIGGGLVDVSVLVRPGTDPHHFEPKPREMTELARAKVYFAIGLAFEEAWLDRLAAANPALKIVRTDEGIEKMPMTEEDHHDEGHDEGHEEGSLDPHVWTSPRQVMVLARNILAGLIEADPGNRAAYEAGYQSFLAELEVLDADLREVFRDRAGMKFLVFHPAWGYLARDYGLVQIPVEIEGKEPKPAQLKSLIELARRERIKVVFVQPQVSARSAELIAREIGGQVLTADPLAEDWGRNLRERAEKFRAALK
ncbi:MAG: zinc ABC transporter substrate-binding protein [Thermodesulfobacteriota bacterium]